MDFPQSGGCQCGAVRYAITGPPRVVYACHCTECQKQSGSAFALAAVIPQESFRITKGAPAMFPRQTSPTKTMECWFCAACGTRLYHVPGGAAPDGVGRTSGTTGGRAPGCCSGGYHFPSDACHQPSPCGTSLIAHTSRSGGGARSARSP